LSAPAPEPGRLPLGVYVHVPYCLKKCPYCDFNSHAREGALPQAAYTDAVVAELRRWAPWAGGRAAGSVFFGGGTPSLFGPGFFATVLEALEREVGMTPDCEVTVEANPGASEAERFAGYRAAGVNRLSIGVQSLNDSHLATLGRVHSAAEARAAVATAREAGFSNLNLDLMFGLPDQGPAEAVADLEGLLALEPEHVALYQLTIEPNTVFWARPPTLPDADGLADTETALRRRLSEAGFGHYEVSNHARPGRACRHNRNYWEFGDYLGLGAGAHGKLTTPEGVLRTRSYAGPEAYLARAGMDTATAEVRTLDSADAVAEFALNAFRLNEAVPLTLFTGRTGLPASALDGPRRRAEAAGLLQSDRDHLTPTERGRAFLNDLVGCFLEAE
jgi:oxygen-independent coproporphyrinogen-3 oxidase